MVDIANVSKVNSTPKANILAINKHPMGATPVPNTFKFRINNASPFTLPIANGGADYNHNFTVDWGDGTSSTIISFDDPSATHNYVSPGTYDITMTGLCEYFSFGGGGDCTQVTKLLEFTGDIGFKQLNFSGCSNLDSVVSLGRKQFLTSLANIFESCTSLTSVPEDLFKYNTSVTTFVGAFSNSGLTSIPADLFKYNTLVTDFRLTFSACSGLSSLPVDLFRHNKLVTSFYQTFQQCTNLASLPVDLFRYNTAVTTFYAVFNGCTNLASLPVDLFRYNTAVTTFSTAFQQCASLVSLPVDLFRYNINVTNFYSTFSECSTLASLPADLFRYNILVAGTGNASFRYIFRSCLVLASIPADLFRYNILAVSFVQAFQTCRKLTLRDDIFWGAGERDTRFYNKTIDFTNCFTRTTWTGIQGTAPDLWNCDFGSGTPTKTQCFSGAGNKLASLTNYADIPTAWKT